MNNLDLIFQQFDKNDKQYLTKHELKLAFIQLFGVKLRYDQVKNIWKQRSSQNAYDEYLNTKGITLEQFKNLCNQQINNISLEEELKMEFHALDFQDKGYINEQDFHELLSTKNSQYLQEFTKKELFRLINQKKNGQIDSKEYIDFFK